MISRCHNRIAIIEYLVYRHSRGEMNARVGERGSKQILADHFDLEKGTEPSDNEAEQA